jgi:hypothetical protein
MQSSYRSCFLNTIKQLEGLLTKRETELSNIRNKIQSIKEKSIWKNKTTSNAAKEFLEKINKPATLLEIFEGLDKLGCFEPNNRFAKRGLSVALAKTKAVFIKLPNNYYGLTKWYDNGGLKQ